MYSYPKTKDPKLAKIESYKDWWREIQRRGRGSYLQRRNELVDIIKRGD